MVKDGNETPEDPSGSYTLNEALEKIGMGWFQYRLNLLCGGICAVDSCQTFMMAFMIPVLDVIWDLQSPWDSMIPITYLVGVMCSSVVWSKVADVYGRKSTLKITLILTAISTTATVFVPNIYYLLICRFFNGFGYMQPVCMVLVLEFSPKQARASNVAFTFYCWTVGGLLSTFLAWLIIPAMAEEVGWRYYVLATSIPVWIVTIATFWLPESAHWLCTTGKFETAEKLIQCAAKLNGKEPLSGRLIREHETIEERGKLKDVFVLKYRKASLVMILSYTTAFYAYYGVAFVSERLFENTSLYISESIINVSELPAIAFGMVMGKIGWKWMTIYTRIIPAFAIMITAILWRFVDSVSYIWMINVVFVFLARGLSLTALMVTGTYLPVYFPTAIRSTAVGLSIGVARLGEMVAIFISEDFEIETSLVIIPIVSLVACFGCIFLTDLSVEKELTNEVDRTITSTQTTVERLNKGIKKQYFLFS